MKWAIASLAIGLLLAERAVGHEDLDREVQRLATAGYEALEKKYFDESFADFARNLELRPKDPQGAYNLACAHSRKGDLKHAIEWLRRAVDWGFSDVERLERDADLDNLRTQSAYKQLLEQLRQQPRAGIIRDTKSPLERPLELVVMIEGETESAELPTKTFGAGILFGYEGSRTYIATANHVVRPGHEARNLRILLRTMPERWFDAQLSPVFDKDLDIAVLSVDGLDKAGAPFCTLPVASMKSAGTLRRGDAVYPVGYPNALWGMPVAPDLIAQVVGDEISFQSAFIARGHSGGALLTENGELVGLLRADEPPYGVAVNFERVLEALRKWKYPVQLRAIAPPARTPLHAAAERDAIDEMRQLISNCADVNAADAFGWTPLHAAAERNSKAAAELLLAAGAETYGWSHTDKSEDAWTRSREWRTPLHVAVAKGSADAVHVLLTHGMNPNVLGLYREEVRENSVWSDRWFGPTEAPLHIAASLGNANLISILTKAGADLNMRDDSGSTPLLRATRSDQLAGVNLLLTLGANPNLADNDKVVPVFVAAKHKRADIVKALVGGKANPNAMNTRHETPLHVAVSQNDYAITSLLLAAGAKVAPDDLTQAVGNGLVDNLKLLLQAKPALNTQGKFTVENREDTDTPMNAAIAIGRLDLVKLLLDSGADMNSPGWNDRTPLVLAMYKKQKAIEAFLIARGASLGKADESMTESLLWDAVDEGRVNAVKKLIAFGVSANSTAGRSAIQSLLSMAIAGGNVEIVRTLLNAGANANNMVYGSTPLELAEKKGNPDIIALIVRAGGKQ